MNIKKEKVMWQKKIFVFCVAVLSFLFFISCKPDKKKPERPNTYFQEFKTGDNVCLAAEPSIHGGMYYPRFHGKAGIVVGKQGKCYEVRIHDVKMPKTVIVHPVHLKRL